VVQRGVPAGPVGAADAVPAGGALAGGAGAVTVTVAGGGTGVEVPEPPQPAVSTAAAATAPRSNTRTVAVPAALSGIAAPPGSSRSSCPSRAGVPARRAYPDGVSAARLVVLGFDHGRAMPDKIAPPRWLKPVNAALLVARRLGLGWTRELPVLTLPGRRSGKLRRTPVSVLDLDGHRYLLAGFPGSDWAANARAAQVGTLTVGRREERVRLVELSPTDAVPVLRAWPVRIPQGAKIMRDAGVVADLEPGSFAALAERCPAFRVEPA
jgi:hypothetical protein